MLVALLLVAYLIGVIVTSVVAGKLADRDIPRLFKGLLGVLGGMVGESVRSMLVYFVILKLFGEQPDPDTWIGNLVVGRYGNIPYLIAWGFIVGSSTGMTKQIKCPGCQQPLLVEKEAAKAKLKPADYEYPHTCASCDTVVFFHPETFEVLRHEPPAPKEEATRPE